MKIIQKEIAVISDLHFGVHLNSETWHKICKNFIIWFKEQLIQRSIRDIIMAGDIFHNRNEISVNTIHVVNEIFNILKDFNIIIIPGNHDVFYKDRIDVHSLGLLNGWENINVINNTCQIEAFNKKIGFCPWMCDYTQLLDCDIIFGHFEINNFKVTPYKICEHGIPYKKLLNKNNLIISGHFHYTDIRKYNEGTILYLGCPYEMYWGDYGSTKGFYILDIPTKETTFIENTISPRYKKIKFTEIIEAGKIPDHWEKTINGNMVLFIVDHNINPDKIDIIHKKILSLKPLNLKIEYGQTDYKNDDIQNLTIENVDIPNNINEFVNLLYIKNKQEVINYIIDLYNTLNK